MELIVGLCAFVCALLLAVDVFTRLGLWVLVVVFALLFALDGHCLHVVYSYFKVGGGRGGV